MGAPRLILAALACAVVSCAATAAFTACVDLAFGAFLSLPELAWAFPLSGLAAYGLYRLFRIEYGWGLGKLIAQVNGDEGLSVLYMPGIFVSTCLTILVGGSVGKEAAALQMSAAISSKTRQVAALPFEDTPLLCACSMASALTVLLGTPIGASVFAVELLGFHARRAWHYLPILASAYLARGLSLLVGLDGLAAVVELPSITSVHTLLFLVVAAGCIAGGALFCFLLTRGRKVFSRHYPTQIVIAGLAAATGITFLFGTTYSGTGMAMIAQALEGNVADPYFLGKAAFTLFVLVMGFKGGEIMPTLCVGSTMGCYLGTLLGLDPTFSAVIGLVAFFTACTNCPLAVAAMGAEAFGPLGLGIYLLVAAASYVATRRLSFYENTTFYLDLLKKIQARLQRDAG